MSRAGSSLFGGGSLDELAIYNQLLSPTTVFAHYHSRDVNLALVPSFTANPSPAVTGQNVTLDASARATRRARSPTTAGTSTAAANTPPTWARAPHSCTPSPRRARM